MSDLAIAAILYLSFAGFVASFAMLEGTPAREAVAGGLLWPVLCWKWMKR